MPKARTDTFEHTISRLLSKRADLLGEAQMLRDRIAEIKNDLDALDRTLNVLGYDCDLDAMMPRQKGHLLFGRGELSRQVFQSATRGRKSAHKSSDRAGDRFHVRHVRAGPKVYRRSDQTCREGVQAVPRVGDT